MLNKVRDWFGFGGFEPDELEASAVRLRHVMDRHVAQRRLKPRRADIVR